MSVSQASKSYSECWLFHSVEQPWTTGDLALSGAHHFQEVALTSKRVSTSIAIIHDAGHAEPWIIAMSAAPSYLSTLDYSRRWGIEPMFSDFKSRGFGIQDTQIQQPDRLGRLILVMSLALCWAVSTGMWDAAENPTLELDLEVAPFV